MWKDVEGTYLKAEPVLDGNDLRRPRPDQAQANLRLLPQQLRELLQPDHPFVRAFVSSYVPTLGKAYKSSLVVQVGPGQGNSCLDRICYRTSSVPQSRCSAAVPPKQGCQKSVTSIHGVRQ